ncbi:hypothetical protein CEXT_607431 [Caerostris extrusa]|uniref:Uncharacterized protein n=1 Tax=Caerostris extrusa TaxID=172846 RepID=A0AAV4X4L6_CAEEX|nr:hypothetical protein CEXT_607431 [Caerostris extrusa]
MDPSISTKQPNKPRRDTLYSLSLFKPSHSCMLTATDTANFNRLLQWILIRANLSRLHANLPAATDTLSKLTYPSCMLTATDTVSRFVSKLTYPSYMLTATDTMSRFVPKITFPAW